MRADIFKCLRVRFLSIRLVLLCFPLSLAPPSAVASIGPKALRVGKRTSVVFSVSEFLAPLSALASIGPKVLSDVRSSVVFPVSEFLAPLSAVASIGPKVLSDVGRSLTT